MSNQTTTPRTGQKYLLITRTDALEIAQHLPEGNLKERFEKDTGGDIEQIADWLKHMPTCMACEIEMQQHTCESLTARKLGRRLWRIIQRASQNTIPTSE